MRDLERAADHTLCTTVPGRMDQHMRPMDVVPLYSSWGSCGHQDRDCEGSSSVRLKL